jgi:3-isopropylmalate/(R)-2-methylmalate dehydratase large subunit
MGMTITEKILARAAGKDVVRPGETVTAKLSLVVSNDVTAPLAIDVMGEMGAKRVWDPQRVAMAASHWSPATDIPAATKIKQMRDFARAQGLAHYFEGACGGIEHCILPEEGLVVAGDVVVGADSHTCTYGALGAFSTGIGSTDCAAAMATGELWFRVPASLKFIFTGQRRQWVGGKDFILHTIGQIGVDGARYMAMEFAGEAIAGLPMHDRLTLCNMAIEAGGKNGIVPPDDETRAYHEGRAQREPVYLASDPGAEYAQVYEWDAGDLDLQVAKPFSPQNVVPVGECGGIKVDQAVLGTCTNGRLEDLRQAAEIIRGKKVAPGVRLIVLPASQRVNLAAVKEGLAEILLEAGANWSVPTCGPCLGGHMGVLAAEEVAISSSNRNFRGRMGHPESLVYLAGPPVVVASAIAGEICGPEDVL